jgi:hypothetical protein
MEYSSEESSDEYFEPNVLVICHGRQHKPQYPNPPDAILIDANPSSKPDLVYNIQKKFYWEITRYLRENGFIDESDFPNNFFDIIELRYCPKKLYKRQGFWNVLKALLEPDGEMIVYGLDETWTKFFKHQGFNVHHDKEIFNWGPPFPIDFLILTV